MSATVRLATPVAKSSVPPAGAEKVLITQVGEPLGIGNGVPKKQPVFVQSTSALMGPGAVDVAPTVQLVPVQLSANRLVAPSGVLFGGTPPFPPPR